METDGFVETAIEHPMILKSETILGDDGEPALVCPSCGSLDAWD